MFVPVQTEMFAEGFAEAVDIVPNLLSEGRPGSPGPLASGLFSALCFFCIMEDLSADFFMYYVLRNGCEHVFVQVVNSELRLCNHR